MRYLSIATAAMLSAGTASAQGDICTAATAIGCGAVVTGNTALFTSDFAPFCGTPNGVGGGVWYRFAGTGATVTASLCGSTYDTGIRIFSGTCATLPCVAGNGDFCGVQSQVTWPSVLATTYYILVHGFGPAAGPYTLSISCVAPPTPMCYAQVAIPYAPDPYAGTALTLSDDIHSGVINMGFGFCFNGSTYTQCVIASNNYITFNLANAGTFSTYTTNALPSLTPASLQNAILNPWHDTYPPAGGTISYQTLGVAPNRRFVVSFLNVPMFSCNSLLVTNQTILYEGTNCIASYTLNKPLCLSSNAGNAVHALQNNGGTSATIVPGRNNAQWTAVSQGILFSPTCAPCSTSTTTQCLTLLPVELLRFHGHSEGDANILEWATASEQNSDVFIVERADDGEHFEPMAVVNGAGNSTAMLEYRVNDPSPVVGLNYYRLRNVDLDGAEELSEVVAIEFIPRNIPQLFPNPGSGTVSFRLPEGVRTPSRLELRDLSGRLVRSMTLTAMTGTLDLGGLAAGTYSVVLPALGEGRAARFIVE
jgi:hypothetical protein